MGVGSGLSHGRGVEELVRVNYRPWWTIFCVSRPSLVPIPVSFRSSQFYYLSYQPTSYCPCDVSLSIGTFLYAKCLLACLLGQYTLPRYMR